MTATLGTMDQLKQLVTQGAGAGAPVTAQDAAALAAAMPSMNPAVAAALKAQAAAAPAPAAEPAAAPAASEPAAVDPQQKAAADALAKVELPAPKAPEAAAPAKGAEPSGGVTAEDMQAVVADFFANQGLSDATRKQLHLKGLKDAVIDSVILPGITAMYENNSRAVVGVFGSGEAYGVAKTWIDSVPETVLSSETRDSIVKRLHSPKATVVAEAAQDLQRAYLRSNPSAVSAPMLQGRAPMGAATLSAEEKQKALDTLYEGNGGFTRAFEAKNLQSLAALLQRMGG